LARILVVDDERVVRELIRAVLLVDGHDVYEARDGKEALALVESEGLPEVILLDLMMPEMDGWRFLEELRARGLRRRTRVIIVSALADEETRTRGTQEGVSTHVSKPFDTDVLLAAVRNALAEPPELIADRREHVRDLAELIQTIDEVLTR
jgi:CheY-like chemotaxis protein